MARKQQLFRKRRARLQRIRGNTLEEAIANMKEPAGPNSKRKPLLGRDVRLSREILTMSVEVSALPARNWRDGW